MSELSLRIKTFFKMNCYIFYFPKASSFAARITSSKSDVDFSIRSNCSFWSDAATRLAVLFMVSHKPVGGTNRICICVQKLQISTVCIPDITSGGRDQNRSAAPFPNFIQKGMQIIRVSSVCHQLLAPSCIACSRMIRYLTAVNRYRGVSTQKDSDCILRRLGRTLMHADTFRLFGTKSNK